MNIIGNGGNIAELLHYVEEHLHSPCKVYPSLAAGVTVAGGAGAWALGNFVTIVPASTITAEFDIHWISIENISANDVYELVLYYGASDIEAGRVRFVKTSVTEAVTNIPFQSIVIPANSQIRAKLASASGGDNVTISLFYHTY